MKKFIHLNEDGGKELVPIRNIDSLSFCFKSNEGAAVSYIIYKKMGSFVRKRLDLDYDRYYEFIDFLHEKDDFCFDVEVL